MQNTLDWSERDATALAASVGYAPSHDGDQALGFVEHRGFDPMSMEEAFGEALAGGPTKSGLVVGPEMALRVAAAYDCRRVIAEDIAKLPRSVVKYTIDPATGRRRSQVMHDHPVHRLLNDAPNDWMTPFEFVEYMIGVATFHPGAYTIVQRDAKGQPYELLPLLPGCCAPDVDTLWQLTWMVQGYGENLRLEPHQVFRINGPMSDPWQGHATVNMAKEAIGLAAAMEASQARFYANDMRPSGTLTTDVVVTAEQRNAIREAWKSAYGAGGQGGVAVLDAKFKFEPITAEGVKSELLENRKLQISDVCRFFRVFPAIIGHNDGSQNFASVEAMFTAHFQHTLHPWAARFEQAATIGLLTASERAQGYRIEIDMDASQRGTPTDRYKSYGDATKVFMTPNEVRIREGLDPIDDDPDMERVQLQRNNTGTAPLALKSPGATAQPVASEPPVPPQ